MGSMISDRRAVPPGPWSLCVSLAASLTLHAAALVVLANVSVRLVSPSVAPISVTLIEPAPPPPPSGGTLVGPVPVAATNNVAHPVRATVARKPQPGRIRRRRPPSRPVAVAPAPPAAPNVAEQAVEAAGVKAGVAGGVSGGQVGGVLGGHGDQLWHADQLATPPVVISRLLPRYPPLARARGIEGLVVLEAIVDRQGHIEPDGLKVQQSVPALDDAAVAAFRQWRFRPGRDRNGEPVRVVLQIPIRFRLR